MVDDETINKVRSIFFPNAHSATQRVIENGKRFVYYTNAETANSILRGKKIWLRNVTTMNDYMEVAHGFDCLNEAYKQQDLRTKFTSLIDGCFEGLTKEVEDMFNAWLPTIRTETYIACLSEHVAEEDEHGRLSMWRAYGGRSGVALVMKGDVLFSKSDVLGAYSSPVGYMNSKLVREQFETVINNIENSIEYVRGMGRDALKNTIFGMMHFAVLCTKHPGFHEEREWRIISSPKIYGTGILESSIEVVRGIPQDVYKISLAKDYPEHNLTGLALPNLLDRIIIGPTEFPSTIRRAFISLLTTAGVADPASKVFVSDIPLRNLD